MHKSEFPIKPYIPTDSTRVFKGTRFDVYTVKRGTTHREAVIHPGAVVILPVVDAERIILIHNERFSVGETLWELPAGTLEPEEDPDDTAKRELLEETGYSSNSIAFLSFFYSSPGICNERMFTYYATDLKQGKQNLDESENITVSIFTWEEVDKMLRNGTIRDAKTIATLLFYKSFIKN